jgi:hypothetical protein
MDELAGGPVLDEGYARELVDRARAEGVNLVGPGGLLGTTRTIRSGVMVRTHGTGSARKR